jgi:hypothetical protein
MPQDAILGYFYLLNGLFAIRCSETQDLRPGAFSAVPTGLNLERVLLTQGLKRARKKCVLEEGIPQRLKPNSLQAFKYGLKAVPFRACKAQVNHWKTVPQRLKPSLRSHTLRHG